MDNIEEGQFDDAEEDCPDKCGNSSQPVIVPLEDLKNIKFDEENEEYDEGDITLESVEWNTQTFNLTRQYMEFVGKVSSGTNPQTKSFNISKVKKYQNNLCLGMYNPLLGSSFRKTIDHKSKNRDKSDQATVEKALDQKTLMILFKMLNRVYSGIYGCVSTGKEANVYYATSMEGRCLAVKVFKTVGSEFRNREQYMVGEYRFRYNTCTKDIRKLVPKWAEKEFRNLHRIYKAGIPSPEPISLNQNVLVMEFLGENGRPAAKLKDVTPSQEQAECFYTDLIKMMRTMFQECKLVHADLSEFNLLVIHGKLYMIDVSQSVEMDNENALVFLKMDVKNVTSFFRKKGVMTMTQNKLLEFIMNPEVEVESFIQNAIKDSTEGNDEDEERESDLDVPHSLSETECYGKDLRRIDVNGVLHRPMINKGKDEDATGNNEEQKDKKENNPLHVRPRDESPESKKERKNAIKEIQRTNRQNKIPKHEKKRRGKLTKNSKA